MTTSTTTMIPGPRAQALVARDEAVFTPAMGRVYPFAMEHGEGCYAVSYTHLTLPTNREV